MLTRLLRLEARVTRWVMVAAVVMLVISVSLGFYQVLTRFIFNAPSTWSETLSRAAMIWCVFLGAAATFRSGYMMAVEVIYKLVPRRTLLALEVVIGACSLLVLGVLVVFGVQMTLRVGNQTLSALEVSMSWPYAAIPVGSAFAMLAIIARLAAQASAREPLGPQTDEPGEFEAAQAAEAERRLQAAQALRGEDTP
jgi:TRAP-type C4-dicarboxylate transport system permease small subunit